MVANLGKVIDFKNNSLKHQDDDYDIIFLKQCLLKHTLNHELL